MSSFVNPSSSQTCCIGPGIDPGFLRKYVHKNKIFSFRNYIIFTVLAKSHCFMMSRTVQTVS